MRNATKRLLRILAEKQRAREWRRSVFHMFGIKA